MIAKNVFGRSSFGINIKDFYISLGNLSVKRSVFISSLKIKMLSFCTFCEEELIFEEMMNCNYSYLDKVLILRKIAI